MNIKRLTLNLCSKNIILFNIFIKNQGCILALESLNKTMILMKQIRWIMGDESLRIRVNETLIEILGVFDMAQLRKLSNCSIFV